MRPSLGCPRSRLRSCCGPIVTGKLLRLFLVLGIGLAQTCVLSAAEPVLTHLHPAAVQRGTTSTVTFIGKFEPWPCQVLGAPAGLHFHPQKSPGVFEVAVDPDFPVGPVLLRTANPDGVSSPVALVIDALPQVTEVEPNNHFAQPMPLDPRQDTVVNGQLEKSGDVDSFGIQLPAGQTLVAWVESHVLGSGMDPMLRLLDEHGNSLAFNHDGPLCMDSLLVFPVPVSGKYVIQIMGHKYPASSEIQFSGGKENVYRLHLATGPVLRHTWPLAISPGFCGPVRWKGWNEDLLPSPADPLPRRIFPALQGLSQEWTEEAHPALLRTPCAVSGIIQSPRSEDRYSFHADKGTPLQISVQSQALGSEMDPQYKLYDPAGREVATQDDQDGLRDPSFVWTAPETGTWTVGIGDLTQQSGPDYYYRLLLESAAPSIRATAPASAWTIPAGKAGTLTATVEFLQGWTQPVALSATPLPKGITAATAVPLAKSGAASLELTVAPETAPGSYPIRLHLTSRDSNQIHPVSFSFVSRTENNGVPQGYTHRLIQETPDFYLTILPPLPPPATAPTQP